jgi:N6-L-threonylcarbamoyladenine synthase
VEELGEELGVKTLIPKFEYCTDNAAMIGITAYYKYLKGAFSDLSLTPATGLGIS